MLYITCIAWLIALRRYVFANSRHDSAHQNKNKAFLPSFWGKNRLGVPKDDRHWGSLRRPGLRRSNMLVYGGVRKTYCVMHWHLLSVALHYIVFCIFVLIFDSHSVYKGVSTKMSMYSIHNHKGTAKQLRVAGFAGPTTLRSCISIRSTARF